MWQHWQHMADMETRLHSFESLTVLVSASCSTFWLCQIPDSCTNEIGEKPKNKFPNKTLLGDSKWPFDLLIRGHQQPFKGSRFHSKKVTSRLARYSKYLTWDVYIISLGMVAKKFHPKSFQSWSFKVVGWNWSSGAWLASDHFVPCWTWRDSTFFWRLSGSIGS